MLHDSSLFFVFSTIFFEIPELRVKNTHEWITLTIFMLLKIMTSRYEWYFLFIESMRNDAAVWFTLVGDVFFHWPWFRNCENLEKKRKIRSQEIFRHIGVAEVALFLLCTIHFVLNGGALLLFVIVTHPCLQEGNERWMDDA